MGRLSYRLLDVFTQTPLAGNPLAVFPDAAGLSGELMQRIAAELNLSETVFVTEGDAASRRYAVRIMTPKTELPFAGHPTIGTAVALADPLAGQEKSLGVQLIEPIGAIDLQVELESPGIGTARFVAPATPRRLETGASREDVAALLGLELEAVRPGAPRAWSAGVPFLCVGLTSADALAAIAFSSRIWQERFAREPAPHIYAYHVGAKAPEEARARMFAPAMGIAEDPATGAAAVAFAGELAVVTGTSDGHLRSAIRQGESMGRPSRLSLEVEVAAGAVTSVRLGGSAVIIGEGALTLP